MENRDSSLLHSIKEYLKEPWLTFCLFVTMAAAYGYELTHNTISVDSFTEDRLGVKEFICQGRIFVAFLLKFLPQNTVIASSVIGICFLALAGVLFCVIIDQLHPGTSLLSRILFVCLFTASPIYAEMLSWKSLQFTLGFGSFVIFCAIYCVLQGEEKKEGRYLYWAVAVLCLMVSASWYESLIQLYITAVFAILILSVIHNQEKDIFQSVLKRGARFFVIVCLAVILKFLLQFFVMKKFGWERSVASNNSINLLQQEELSLNWLRHSLRYKFFYPALWYFPITLFVGTKIAAMLLSLGFLCKRKWTAVLLFLGLHLSNLLLSILLWNAAPLRTSHSFGFYSAFIFFVILHLIEESSFPKVIRVLFAGFGFWLLFVQVSEISFWTELNHKRYEEETCTVREVGRELFDHYDVKNKPVVFTGEYIFSEYIREKLYVKVGSPKYRFIEKIASITGKTLIRKIDDDYGIKIPDSTIQSYINWGIWAWDYDSQLYKLFEYEGYSLIKDKGRDFDTLFAETSTYPKWPDKGSIRDMGDFILVHF